MVGKKESCSDSDSNKSSTISSCYSTDIDRYNADYSDENYMIESKNGKLTPSSEDDIVEMKDDGKGKEKKINLFFRALSPKERKVRIDKLDLSTVREFCHEICRLDTFASTKIFVHNYDGTHSYHEIHIRSHSLIEYYKFFEESIQYNQWQNENKRENNKKYKTEPYIYPTIKFRAFTIAFCPCCLKQNQHDCANHVQVNLNNALKALGNNRRFQSIANSIKPCGCVGHRNENYLRCATSLSCFKEAVMCPRTSYPDLPENKDFQMTIENMENKNIEAESKNKQKYKARGCS